MDKKTNTNKNLNLNVLNMELPISGQQNEDSKSVVSTSNTSTKPIEWSPENEAILVEWCDVAQCYKWMNNEAHCQYKYILAWFTIPAIVLSTISGTASFAQGSVPESMQNYFPAMIGAVNIFVGILTTIQQYLKIAELNEAHRVSVIAWDKFSRNIRIELSKAPIERMDAGHFLKLSRQEYDRLMETSPTISGSIANKFQKTFIGKPGSMERKRFEELKKPDICNIIISANEYRHGWYKDILTSSQELNETNTEFDIHLKEKILTEKVEEVQEKERMLYLKELEEKKKEKQKEELKNVFQKNALEVMKNFKLQTKKIDDYVHSFKELHGRNPLTDEISDNMREEVSMEVLSRYLEKYTLEDPHNMV